MNTANVVLGDLSLVASYEVHGQHLLATAVDPEEFVEVELLKLTTAGGEDVSGLLEFAPVYEAALEQVERYERDDREAAAADEAYDRWRDEQMARDSARISMETP